MGRAMKVIQPVVQCVVQAGIATVLTSASFSQPPSPECKEITIDSVGTIGFKSTAAEAIAPHEIAGLALFVLVRPPASQSGISNDIVRISVSANIVPRPQPLCRRGVDIIEKRELITCFRSLRGDALQIAVQYKMPYTIITDGQYEGWTNIVANYISDEVLCRIAEEVPELR
jgi:hypothetical protein